MTRTRTRTRNARREPSLLNKLTTILCFLMLGCVLIWSFADRQAYYDSHHHSTR